MDVESAKIIEELVRIAKALPYDKLRQVLVFALQLI